MNPEDIPGMTELIEQKLLNDIGQSVKLEADEVMLEFGTFFVDLIVAFLVRISTDYPAVLQFE